MDFPLMLLLMDNEEDRLFLEGLYVEYHRLMYAQAYRVMRNEDAAQDVVSDSLMALMNKISLLRTLECNKLRAYIVITVRHTAISRLNKGRREVPADEIAFRDLSDGFRIDDQLLDQAGVEGIKEAVRLLPPQQRDLMLMRYFREMDDQEIAEETGLKPVSVRVQLSRARKKLAEILQGKGEGR